MFYLPGALSLCVYLKWYVIAVHQHPKVSFQVKRQVKRTMGQGKPAVWHKFFIIQAEKLNYRHTKGIQKTLSENRSIH